MIKGIALRDVFTKAAKGIEKSVDLGEDIVQYDPGHAELPCATLRFLLRVRKGHLLTAFKVFVQGINQQGLIVESADNTAKIVIQYGINRRLYPIKQ